MTALLVAVSSVLLVRVVTEPNRRRVVAYVLATLAMLYSLAFAAPVILAQGLFVVGIGLAQGFRQGWRAMLLRYRNALLAVTLVAMAYVPYVIMALHYQASSYAKAAAPQRSLGSLGWTAYVHTVNEELFRFSSTGRLLLGGLLALGLCVPLCKRSWSGVLWLLMAFVQVTFVWLFVTGRSLLWFQGKYMTPAFIALCWLGALGVQHVFPLLRRGLWLALPFLLGWLVWGEYGKFRAYFASSQPLGFFQSFYRTLSEQPGKKVVFFDLGYDGQHLEYQSRNDRDVTVATMRGRGWASAGNNHLEPGYVSSVIDQTAPITRCYYYVIADPQGPYQSTFVPRLSGLGFAPRPSLRVARRLTPVYCRE